MSGESADKPGCREGSLWVALNRAAGEVVPFDAPEDVAVRELVGRQGALREPRSVVIQIARPASDELEVAESSVGGAGPVPTALAGALPDILGLPGRLERAVEKLPDNACQAASKRITVRTRENRDGTIGISAADSGAGISEEHLAHVQQYFLHGPAGWTVHGPRTCRGAGRCGRARRDGGYRQWRGRGHRGDHHLAGTAPRPGEHRPAVAGDAR